MVSPRENPPCTSGMEEHTNVQMFFSKNHCFHSKVDTRRKKKKKPTALTLIVDDQRSKLMKPRVHLASRSGSLLPNTLPLLSSNTKRYLSLENYLLSPSLSYEIRLIRRNGARFAYSIRSPHISRVERCTPPVALPPLTRERTPRAPTRAAHFGQLTPSAETSGPFASWAPPLLAQSGGGDAVDCGGGGGPRWWWQ